MRIVETILVRKGYSIPKKNSIYLNSFSDLFSLKEKGLITMEEKDLKMGEIQKSKDNLALFGVKEIQITKEDVKKAKLENDKDKEALEIPTFISINTRQLNHE